MKIISNEVFGCYEVRESDWKLGREITLDGQKLVAIPDNVTNEDNEMQGVLRFEWQDDPDIGHYECTLYEGNKKIDDITFSDYVCEFSQKYDRERRFRRAYAFSVHWCHGWSMTEGFDYDENYDSHYDEDGCVVGGYQGNCTHTVDDIKRWCENWLAQRYLGAYYGTLNRLGQMRDRALWFESQGFCLEDTDNK